MSLKEEVLLREAKKIIEKYYTKDLVNLNNINNPISYELSKQIINLRKNISEYFFINNWENIIFFPNNFYLKNTIIHSLNLNKEWNIYLDGDESYFDKNLNIFKTNFLSEEDIKIEKLNNKKTLFWITKTKQLPLFKKQLEKYKSFKNLKIFFETNELSEKYLWKQITPYINFFLFNPSNILYLHGISILGLNKKTKLKPKYFGSNSVRKLSFNSYLLKKNYEVFECGTQNFPVLLVLHKFFELLNKKEKK